MLDANQSVPTSVLIAFVARPCWPSNRKRHSRQHRSPQRNRKNRLLVFRESVEEVTAPVLVFDSRRQLRERARNRPVPPFRQRQGTEHSGGRRLQPISLVICLQVNAHVEGILPQIRKIGNLIAPLMIGDQGEAAVIGFDSRIRTLQDWTTDADKITKSVKTSTAAAVPTA